MNTVRKIARIISILISAMFILIKHYVESAILRRKLKKL